MSFKQDAIGIYGPLIGAVMSSIGRALIRIGNYLATKGEALLP